MTEITQRLSAALAGRHRLERQLGEGTGSDVAQLIVVQHFTEELMQKVR